MKREHHQPSTEAARDERSPRVTHGPPLVRVCGGCGAALELAGAWYRFNPGQVSAMSAHKRRELALCPKCYDDAGRAARAIESRAVCVADVPTWGAGTPSLKTVALLDDQKHHEATELTDDKPPPNGASDPYADVEKHISAAFLAVAGLGANWPETRDRVRSAILDLQASEAILDTLPTPDDSVFD